MTTLPLHKKIASGDNLSDFQPFRKLYNFLKGKKSDNTIILLFILAFTLRLAYLIFLKTHYFFFEHPSDDVQYYLAWADDIARGNWLGTKTFYGLPLYPYFLAVLKRLFLNNNLLIHLIHLILGSLNCVFIFKISQQLFKKRIAVLGGLLTASNFILIYYDCLATAVPLIILFSLVMIDSFLNQKNLTNKKSWFILGTLLGISTLADGKFLIFAFLLLIYLVITNRKNIWLFCRQKLFPLTLAFVLILSITGLRNKIVGGSWVLISAQTGLSFYVGNNPQADGIYANPDFIRPNHEAQDEDQIIIAESALQKKLTDREVSQFWRNQALSFIKNNPKAYLELLSKKFLLFFTETERTFDMDLIFQRNWKRMLDINPYFVICPIALLGLFLSRNNPKTVVINLMIISQLIFTLIFFLNNRHRAAILPLFIIYEAYALDWLANKIRDKNFLPLFATGIFMILFWITFRPTFLNAREVDFLRYSKMGPIYEHQKNYTKAQEQYFKALEITPNDTNSLNNLANSFFLEKNFSSAKKYYNQVLKLNPQHIDALYNLAYTYEHTEQTSEALTLYAKVTELQRNSIDAYLGMANIYQKKGDCQKAYEQYQRAIELKPQFKNEIQLLITQCQNK